MVKDNETNKYEPLIDIQTIDNAVKLGKDFIPDSQEATGHILFATGMDPSIVGVSTPGGKMGAGSGSDKREALTIYQTKLWNPRNKSLEWLEFVRDYNGWNPNYKFGFIDLDASQTLDENPNGKQNKIS